MDSAPSIEEEILRLDDRIRELQAECSGITVSQRNMIPSGMETPSGTNIFKSTPVRDSGIPSGRRSRQLPQIPMTPTTKDDSSAAPKQLSVDAGREVIETKRDYSYDFPGLGHEAMSGITFRPIRDSDKGSVSSKDRISARQNDRLAKSGNCIKPATFDGTGSWLDYRSHFFACAELTRWTKRQKALYLAASLRGQAQGVLGNLPGGAYDFEQLMQSLEERFAPSNQTELYRVQLRERRQKAAETLPELGQDIRRLVNLAYPTAPNDVRETLAKEQFIDALAVSDMRLRVKQVRPVDLNDAVRHAVELEAFHKAAYKRDFTQGSVRQTVLDVSVEAKVDALADSIVALSDALQSLICEVSELKRTMSSNEENDSIEHNTKQRRCYECGSPDHIRPACPTLDTSSNEVRTCKVVKTAMSQVTPSEQFVCPICRVSVHGEFSHHVIGCAASRVTCSLCKTSFKKQKYLTRHVRVKHSPTSIGNSEKESCSECQTKKCSLPSSSLVKTEENIPDDDMVKGKGSRPCHGTVSQLTSSVDRPNRVIPVRQKKRNRCKKRSRPRTRKAKRILRHEQAMDMERCGTMRHSLGRLIESPSKKPLLGVQAVK